VVDSAVLIGNSLAEGSGRIFTPLPAPQNDRAMTFLSFAGHLPGNWLDFGIGALRAPAERSGH
ncbi:hypothetical protein, partial [Pseudomonas viridiflava]|uniref:hypothetical protein n=1 Tax=Pseudomonas viridiflava TaxID=33069 RepID=UPI001968502F